MMYGKFNNSSSSYVTDIHRISFLKLKQTLPQFKLKGVTFESVPLLSLTQEIKLVVPSVAERVS